MSLIPREPLPRPSIHTYREEALRTPPVAEHSSVTDLAAIVLASKTRNDGLTPGLDAKRVKINELEDLKSIAKLPTEVLEHIFSYLRKKDLVNVRQVNKNFHEICLSEPFRVNFIFSKYKWGLKTLVLK